MIMEVGAGEPDRTVADFIARARAGRVNYAHAGLGGPPHMAAALFLKSQGLNILDVPHKGNGPALVDVIGGQVAMIFDGYISSVQYLQSGKLRPLAVTGTSRIAPLPNVPTFVEQGINYTYTLWLGLVVKAGAPEDAIQRLSDALRYALSSKEVAERFAARGPTRASLLRKSSAPTSLRRLPKWPRLSPISRSPSSKDANAGSRSRREPSSAIRSGTATARPDLRSGRLDSEVGNRGQARNHEALDSQ